MPGSGTNASAPESTGRHAGRTIVVTGAAMGLGQEYARRLASEGARIVLADIADLAETSNLVEAEGSEVLTVGCDVASAQSVDALRAAADDFGGADALVHNAGIYPRWGSLDEATFDMWRRIMSVNLDSMFLLCKALVPRMVERGWGRVVGVATGLYYDGGPPWSAAYMASKGGIIGFVRSLAGEVGPAGVTVNAVAPGLTRTHGSEAAAGNEAGPFEELRQAQAIKRNGVPSDLAGVVSFLISDDASWMTGQTLLVDGGKARA